MASIFSKRIIAYLLDFFVLSMFMWLVSYGLSLIIKPVDSYSAYQFLPYIVPVFIYLYFILCEKLIGATVGKSLMYLKVQSFNGANISWLQSIVRNVTKILWFPIIFDWLIGKFIGTDRLFSYITRTIVVRDK
ncbi:MAG: RDD family protein [Methanobrevibacter thaueri]|nr:RDD family protein [Methanobrevibacter thaueri]